MQQRETARLLRVANLLLFQASRPVTAVRGDRVEVSAGVVAMRIISAIL
jgi:hypothetical protein